MVDSDVIVQNFRNWGASRILINIQLNSRPSVLSMHLIKSKLNVLQYRHFQVKKISTVPSCEQPGPLPRTCNENMASFSPAGWPLPQRTSDMSSSVVLNQCLSTPLWRRLGASSRETASIHPAGKTVKAQKKNKHEIWLYPDNLPEHPIRKQSNCYICITTGSDITCMQELKLLKII